MGASKQKLLLGVGLPGRILFWETRLTPGPTGSTHSKGGISYENWVGASKQKLLLGVGLPGRVLFLGARLTPGPTHSRGVFAFEQFS